MTGNWLYIGLHSSQSQHQGQQVISSEPLQRLSIGDFCFAIHVDFPLETPESYEAYQSVSLYS
jgi:hypothetical protein